MYLKENCFKVLTIFEKITKPNGGYKKSLAIAWERVQSGLEVIDKWLTYGNELDIKFSRIDVCR
ncbi:MAG: hypothetical protein WBE34_18135 [Candidatus Nitrosopolaris sp.]